MYLCRARGGAGVLVSLTGRGGGAGSRGPVTGGDAWTGYGAGSCGPVTERGGGRGAGREQAGAAQRFGVGPGPYVHGLGQEAVGAQGLLLPGEEAESGVGQVGVEGAVGAGPVGARDALRARAGLGAEDVGDLVRLPRGPVGGAEQDGEEPVDEVGALVQEVLVHGEGSGSAVVDAVRGVGQLVELDGHLGPGAPGGLDGEGALHVDGVDLAPAQGGQLGGPLALVPVGGHVDEDGVGESVPRRGEHALEAAQGHRAPEVDGDGVAGHGEPESAQGGGSAHRGAGGDEHRLPLLDPGEADEPGALAPGTGPQRGDVAALAEEAGEGVGEVGGAVGAGFGVLERADGDAVGRELPGQPAPVGGDAGGGGDGAAGEPERVGNAGVRHGGLPGVWVCRDGDGGGRAGVRGG